MSLRRLWFPWIHANYSVRWRIAFGLPCRCGSRMWLFSCRYQHGERHHDWHPDDATYIMSCRKCYLKDWSRCAASISMPDPMQGPPWEMEWKRASSTGAYVVTDVGTIPLEDWTPPLCGGGFGATHIGCEHDHGSVEWSIPDPHKKS